jgi:hypothetical protein
MVALCASAPLPFSSPSPDNWLLSQDELRRTIPSPFFPLPPMLTVIYSRQAMKQLATLHADARGSPDLQMGVPAVAQGRIGGGKGASSSPSPLALLAALRLILRYSRPSRLQGYGRGVP